MIDENIYNKLRTLVPGLVKLAKVPPAPAVVAAPKEVEEINVEYNFDHAVSNTESLACAAKAIEENPDAVIYNIYTLPVRMLANEAVAQRCIVGLKKHSLSPEAQVKYAAYCEKLADIQHIENENSKKIRMAKSLLPSKWNDAVKLLKSDS